MPGSVINPVCVKILFKEVEHLDLGGETADVLGVATGTVRKHLERGMAKLRGALEVDVGD